MKTKRFVIMTATFSGWDLVDTTEDPATGSSLTIYDSKKEAQAEIDEVIRNFPAGHYAKDEFKIVPYQRGIHEQKWLEDTGRLND
jgi:hypothetical protein